MNIKFIYLASLRGIKCLKRLSYEHNFFKNMIAVVEIGGKQYTVEQGQVIEVDHQDLEVGASLEVSALLLSDAE